MERGFSGYRSSQNTATKLYAAILVILAVIIFIVFLLFYSNINIKHTVGDPPNAPGVVTSDRYTAEYWLIFTLAWKFVLFASVLALIIWSGLSRCCSIMFYTLFLVFLVVDVVGFVYLVRSGATCNGKDEAFNICNHALRCCDPVINSNSASGCLAATTCVDPIPQFPNIAIPVVAANLPWDENFKTLFWMSFTLLIVDVFLLFAVISLSLGSDPKKRKPQHDPLEEAENQLEEEFIDDTKAEETLEFTPTIQPVKQKFSTTTNRNTVKMRSIAREKVQIFNKKI